MFFQKRCIIRYIFAVVLSTHLACGMEPKKDETGGPAEHENPEIEGMIQQIVKLMAKVEPDEEKNMKAFEKTLRDPESFGFAPDKVIIGMLKATLKGIQIRESLQDADGNLDEDSEHQFEQSMVGEFLMIVKSRRDEFISKDCPTHKGHKPVSMEKFPTLGTLKWHILSPAWTRKKDGRHMPAQKVPVEVNSDGLVTVGDREHWFGFLTWVPELHGGAEQNSPCLYFTGFNNGISEPFIQNVGHIISGIICWEPVKKSKFFPWVANGHPEKEEFEQKYAEDFKKA